MLKFFIIFAFHVCSQLHDVLIFVSISMCILIFIFKSEKWSPKEATLLLSQSKNKKQATAGRALIGLLWEKRVARRLTCSDKYHTGQPVVTTR